MIRFLRRRIAHSALALIGLIIAVFFLARLTGDPSHLYLPLDASLDARAAFAEKHGFNDSLVRQFARFVVALTQFDLGRSIRKEQPALQVVLAAYPTTLGLALVTMTLALLLSVVVGSLAAYRPGGVFDRVSSLTSLAGASAPDFWIAIVAVLLFAVQLGWLPTSGTGGPAHWVLPVAVLVIRPFGLLVQVVRAAMLNALSSPYVKTARAKGVRERAVIFVHSLRNAWLPILAVTGDLTAGLVNGAVIVETIFGWPGIGKLMIDAVIQRDYAVVQAAVLVTAVVIFMLNILIDILYGLLDPRVRQSG